MYPIGFKYFELEIKIRYSHKKPLTKMKINVSDNTPKKNILKISIALNDVCVIGWKSKTIRKMTLTEI
jgi:hypothetical protein